MALQGGAKAMQLDCRARMEGPLDRPLAGRAGRGVSPRPRNPQLKIRLIGEVRRIASHLCLETMYID